MLRKMILTILFGLTPAALHAGEPMKLLIPMYFYPHMTDGVTSDPDWLAVAAAAEQVDVVAIVNIGNGLQDPVSAGDAASYTAAMQLLDDAGVKMIGYVSSDYACNDLDDIKTAVGTYATDWPLISGIFVDETTNKLIATEADERCPAKVDTGFNYGDFYAQLSQHIRNHLVFDLVVYNPGTDVPPDFIELADVIVSFESQAENWETDHTGDAQASGAAGSTQFATLVYDTAALTPEQIAYWIELADARSYGYLHFTDDPGWGALPTYMDEFVTALWCHNTPELCDDFSPEPEPDSSSNGGGVLLWLPLIALLFRLRRRTMH